MHPEKEWFKQAKKQTIETLPEFMNHIMNDYCHDYGTVCHAVAACAMAAVYAANHHPSGGITGFQAGFVMWDIIRQTNYPSNKCGMKLIDYDNMLYPQYAYSCDSEQCRKPSCSDNNCCVCYIKDKKEYANACLDTQPG